MKSSGSKPILVILFVLVLGLTLMGQDRKQLEKKKKQTEEQIKLTQRILKQTGKEKQDNLYALSVLSNLIKAREKLIYTLTRQVHQVQEALQNKEQELLYLEEKIKIEKQNLAKLIVNTYKTRESFAEWMFVFSAENVFQGLNRVRFLQRINSEQDRLIASIQDKQEQVNLAVIQLKELKLEKESLLAGRIQERSELEGNRSQKNQIVQALSGKEKELKDKLAKQQAAFDELNRQIKLAIEREMELARKKREEEARKKGQQPPSGVITLTPEAQALSNDFAENRNKLPWPVQKGFVSQKFGRFAHPTLTGIYVENNGIDIATENNAKVRAVFRGEVSAIFSVPGMGKAVLISHGEYYTVYAKLTQIYVVQGQKVSVKEPIGAIQADETGKTELHFEVWKNQEKLNPQSWITPL